MTEMRSEPEPARASGATEFTAVNELASRVSGKDAAGRYELKHERPHHDHLICVACGTIIEFQSPEMERYQNEAVKRHRFQMLWHRHEIFGRCEACLPGMSADRTAGGE